MAMTEQNTMRKKMANTIRFLAADMVQKANSGHPGAPMGLADIAVVLGEKLSHNPKNPKWLNRDRLIFSGGHASALIYSLLHLWGYDLTLDDLKDFRQLDSKTPGHPESGHTDGIEITTGPLGQGIANAVGFAMAEAFTANQVNSETCELIDHKVYCLCGDGDLAEKEWIHRQKEAPLLEQNEALDRLLNPDFSAIQYPDFSDAPEVATRDSNGKILNAIATAIPSFIGGSADLAPSNKSDLKELGDFPKGRNIHFGIREHSMAAITNAMALYGTTIPFNATFFVFSDYQKPSVRIAALTSIQNFFVWTHDSIGVGEDGPTHEPIEQISQFRALPNFYVWRPADATENVEAWKTALEIKAPHGFVLSRQKLKTLKPKRDFGEVSKGAYIVKKRKDANFTLMASGSELMPCLKAACYLKPLGIVANVVSVPCLDLFNEQDAEYKATVVDPNTKVLAVEAATATEFYRYADDVLGMESFGASAPADLLFEKFGFTKEGIMKRACKLMDVEYREVDLGECEL